MAIYRAGARPAVVLEKRRLQLPQPHTDVVILCLPSTLSSTPVHFRSLADPHATAVVSDRRAEALVAPTHHVQEGREAELAAYRGWGCSLTFASGETAEGIVGGVEEGRLELLQLQPPREGQEEPNVRRRLIPLQHSARPDAAVAQLRLSRPSTLSTELVTHILQPKLLWSISTPHPGDHPVELLYECSGLQWEASYILNVDTEKCTAELLGRFTLSNMSGKSFEDVEIGLVDPRGTAPTPFREEAKMDMSSILSKAKSSGGAKGRSEAEVAYAVPGCSLLPSGEVRTVTFVHAKEVPVEHACFISCGQQDADLDQLVFNAKEHSSTIKNYGVRSLVFKNNAAAGLGAHMPAGDLLVRVSGKELNGAVTTSVVHSSMLRCAPGELVCVPLQLSSSSAETPDVTALRERRGLRKDSSKHSITEGVQITVTNNFRPTRLVVEDALYRWPNWQIQSSTPAHVASGNRRICWELPRSQIGDKIVLRYTVVYFWTGDEAEFSDEEVVAPGEDSGDSTTPETSLGRLFSRFSKKK